MEQRRDLRLLFNARSICIVGASGDPTRLTGRSLYILTRHNFPGKIFPVNPKYQEISSYPCYPSIKDLPEIPDVALISIAAQFVPTVIEECGKKGIKNAVVLSSGFEEVPEGKSLALDLIGHAKRFGVNIVGPNSEGIWSIPSNLILTFGSAALRNVIYEGGVTVLSQSGSVGGAAMRILQDRGVGCRFFVSVGNETDLTIMDYLEYVIEDGLSKVVLMFLEGLKDGWRLKDLVRAGKAKGIQIVALKAGASEAGMKATASHTGKIASPKKVYSSIFSQSGILEVDTIGEFIQVAETLNAASPPPILPGSSGLGIMSISGGSRALIADACEERGVPMAVFSPRTEKLLASFIPSFGYYKNPVDPTGQVLSAPELFEKTVNVIADDPHSEAIMIQYGNRGPRQVEENLDFLCGFVAKTGKPLVVSFLGEEIKGDVKKKLMDNGTLVATAPDEAVKLLSWLYYGRGRDKIDQGVQERGLPQRKLVNGSLTTWQEQVTFLDACGIRVPQWRILKNAAGLSSLGRSLSFPVVAKALPEYSRHKTDQGLVHVSLSTLEGLENAFNDLQQKLGDNKQVLVQEMITGGVEVLLTVRRDPDFGPVLAIGSGGVLVELFQDVSYLSLPLQEQELLQAIESLKLGRLLKGFRGQRPRDIQALLRAAVSISEAYLSSYPQITEFELNPLFVLEEGRGVVAVDVLAE